jgi:SpoVK/Ycf46/Vps4 family AAA+-type ATPase
VGSINPFQSTEFLKKNGLKITEKLPKLTLSELSTISRHLHSNPHIEITALLKDLLGERNDGKESKSIDFLSISGMKAQKEMVQDVLLGPSRYPKLYKNIKVRLPKNILLYGYSGCGKTFLAKSLEKEFNVPFFYVKGPEVLNKYIGASEENVRKLFEKAQACAPSILFFDEFDSIAQQRGNKKIKKINVRIGKHRSY